MEMNQNHRALVSVPSLIILMNACFLYPFEGQIKRHRLTEFILPVMWSI